MEFMSPGDPHQWWAPSTAELLAQLAQPVAVLTARPPGSRLDIGGGGFDDQIWCIDVDYRFDQQLGARVRTIRELTRPPGHGFPGDFLRSTLIEFSVNAELAAGTAVPDPNRARGMQLTVRQEQQAALATASASKVNINGHDHAAETLQIPGYAAYMTSLDQATVVYVGNDETLAPALRMTNAPGED